MQDSSATAGEEEDSEVSSVVPVERSGDLLLIVRALSVPNGVSYVVSSTKLQNASKYFASALNPNTFSEGRVIADQIVKLTLEYGQDLASTPVSKLPRLYVDDIGQLNQSPANKKALKLFLRLLHTPSMTVEPTVFDLEVAARAAVIADRFMALWVIQPHIQNLWKNERNWLQRKKNFTRNELKWRKRILLGYLFDVAGWVMVGSSHLINGGSRFWDQGDEDVPGKDCMWADLPGGLEDELRHRRECVLLAFGSIPSYLLRGYVASQQQCRLGYGNSRECDMFQFGQTVRFLAQKNLLGGEGHLIDLRQLSTLPQPRVSIHELIKTLRMIPQDQIDSHHSHCGIMKFLRPQLDYLVNLYLEPDAVEVCLSCWKTKRAECSWLKNPVGGLWNWKGRAAGTPSKTTCADGHGAAREMFTAGTWDWEL